MTSERYRKEVAELELADPKNMFLGSLQRGYSAANVAYLKAAWQKVPQNTVTTSRIVAQSVPKHTDNAPLLPIFREKGSLDRRLRKLSNQLHTCGTDAERADLVDEIMVGQRKIGSFNKTIRLYEETGKLPEEKLVVEATPEDAIPTDGLALAAALQVARTSIIRYRKEVEKIPMVVIHDETHPMRGKYKRMHAQLKKWEIRKALLENAINQGR